MLTIANSSIFTPSTLELQDVFLNKHKVKVGLLGSYRDMNSLVSLNKHRIITKMWLVHASPNKTPGSCVTSSH